MEKICSFCNLFGIILEVVKFTCPDNRQLKKRQTKSFPSIHCRLTCDLSRSVSIEKAEYKARVRKKMGWCQVRQHGMGIMKKRCQIVGRNNLLPPQWADNLVWINVFSIRSLLDEGHHDLTTVRRVWAVIEKKPKMESDLEEEPEEVFNDTTQGVVESIEVTQPETAVQKVLFPYL